MIALMVLFGLLGAFIGALVVVPVTVRTNSDRPCVIGLIVGGLLGALLAIPIHRSAERAGIKEQRQHSAWFNTMKSANCKRTSYTGTKYHVYPVWTCPDGQAYIQNF